MAIKQRFRTSEAAKLTGLTQRQFNHWGRTGLSRPSLVQAEGRGNARFYILGDVERLMIVRELQYAEVSQKTLRKAVEISLLR